MTDVAPWGPIFPPRPAWSGIGAENWDGTVGPDDLRLLSASSVPDALKSEQLERWAIKETVTRLADRLPEFHARLQQDRDEAIYWATGLRFESSDDGTLSATATGTLLHALLESWLLGTQITPLEATQISTDPVITAMANNLWGWFNKFKPVAVAVEQVVFDPLNGLAGRLDSIVRFENAPELGTVLLDLKNTRDARYPSGGLKGPHADSQALQLATYFHAPLVATFEPRLLITQRKSDPRVYLLNTAEREACAPATPLDGAFILHNSPEMCRLFPLRVDRAVHRRSLDAAGIHRWMFEESRNAVGKPVPAPLPPLPDLS